MNHVIFWSGIWSSVHNDLTRPIASYQLSHWLRKHRINCQVIEFVQFMKVRDLIDLTELAITNNTFCIAISTTFWPFDGSVPEHIDSAISYIKLKYPKVEIIGGGPRASRYKNIFNRVFLGESENDFLKYCQEKKLNLSLPNSRFDIVNLDHKFIEQDVILENETLPLELGRGCIFKCKFCSYPNIGKKKYTYQRNHNLVLDEIKWNYENFGTTNYMFLDDTVNEDPEKVNFLSQIKNLAGFDITWNGYLRADLIWSHKNHNQLYDSGLRNVYFGIESLHPKTATIIGKGWNGSQAKDWLPILYNDLWSKEVTIEGSFIVGLPYEPKESLFASAAWVNEFNAGRLFFLPFNLKHNHETDAPTSEFTRNYQDYGYTIDDNDMWRHDSGITQAESVDLAEELNNIVRPNWRVSGWRSASFYNLGFKHSQVKDIKIADGNQILLDRVVGFMETYIKKYKSIVGRQ